MRTLSLTPKRVVTSIEWTAFIDNKFLQTRLNKEGVVISTYLKNDNTTIVISKEPIEI